MKMRTAWLAFLPALALPLVSCMRSPPQGPKAQTGKAVAWSPMGPATFPHEKHATEFGIECVKCHHETNAKPLSIPHQNYFDDLWIDCGTCHHKAGAEALGPQACSTCHHAKNGDIADETLSAKVVIHKNCWTCHEVGVGAAASATCKTCHPARS
jgi:hypothetical protein